MKFVIKFIAVFIFLFTLLSGLAYIHNKYGMTSYLIQTFLLISSLIYLKNNQ